MHCLGRHGGVLGLRGVKEGQCFDEALNPNELKFKRRSCFFTEVLSKACIFVF